MVASQPFSNLFCETSHGLSLCDLTFCFISFKWSGHLALFLYNKCREIMQK